MALQDQVSDNVRVFAAARGTSPAAVAEALGMSRQWIQNKMAGRSRWSVQDVEAIGRQLGVDAADLVTTDWWPDQLRARRDSNPKPSDLSLAA